MTPAQPHDDGAYCLLISMPRHIADDARGGGDFFHEGRAKTLYAQPRRLFAPAFRLSRRGPQQHAPLISRGAVFLPAHD